MREITERLRAECGKLIAHQYPYALLKEAADEIERLEREHASDIAIYNHRAQATILAHLATIERYRGHLQEIYDFCSLDSECSGIVLNMAEAALKKQRPPPR